MKMKNSQIRKTSIVSLIVIVLSVTNIFCGDDLDNKNFTINSGKVSLTIGTVNGGRITSFKLNDYEFLVPKGPFPSSFGSTLWPSPQSNWNWPPPAVLDSKNYSVLENGETVKLISGEDNRTGYQIEKIISAGQPNHIKLTYTIKNISNENKQVAPWEISRTKSTGLMFFPQGNLNMGLKFFPAVPTEEIAGVTWYDGKAPMPKEQLLSYTDGLEGWQAYAIDGKLFIKKFDDIKPEELAPGEGEVLFYLSEDKSFMEIELEGKYQELKPGDKLTWSVEWIAVDIPENIKVEKGSYELVEFVRSVVK